MRSTAAGSVGDDAVAEIGWTVDGFDDIEHRDPVQVRRGGVPTAGAGIGPHPTPLHEGRHHLGNEPDRRLEPLGELAGLAAAVGVGEEEQCPDREVGATGNLKSHS